VALEQAELVDHRGWWTKGAWTLAIVAAVLVASFFGFRSSASASSGYRTAEAEVNTVRQTLSVSGATDPVHQATAAFQVAGTVSAVNVTVGQHVTAGETLSSLDTTSLEQDVSSAQLSLSGATAALSENEAGESSGSSSNGSGSSSGGSTASLTAYVTTTSSTTPTGTSGTAPTGTTGSSGSGGSGSGGSGSGSSGSGSTGGTGSGSGSQSSTITKDQQAVVTAQQTADADSATAAADFAQAQAACGASSGGGSAPKTTPTTPTTTPTTTSTTSPTSASTACSAALSKTLAAQQQVTTDQNAVASAENTLNQALSAAASSSSSSSSSSTATTGGGSGSASQGTSGSTGKTTTGGSSSTDSGSSGTSTDTAEQLASDQATIDSDKAALIEAQQSLADAQLTTPIAGTVASVGLTTGQTVTAGSSTDAITIINSGTYEVSASLTSTQAAEVKVGDPVLVNVDGVSATLAGTVARVGPVETSDSSDTYPLIVALSAGSHGIAAGSSGQMKVVLHQDKGTLSVPTSAVHFTAAHSSYVEVLESGQPVRKKVTAGAIGGDYTQIISGIKKGTTVVLADLSEAVPTSSTNATTRGFGGGGFGGGGFGGGGFSGGGFSGRGGFGG
jgi:trimeric autotransporter adhesin